MPKQKTMNSDRSVVPHNSQIPQPSSGMWLDRMPVDVCARIAAFLTRQSTDSINFAKVNPNCRLGVVQSTRYCLIPVSTYSRSHVQDLASVFGLDLRELHISDCMSHHAFSLLKLPSLTRVSIPAIEPCVLALAEARNLKSLALEGCSIVQLDETHKMCQLVANANTQDASQWRSSNDYEFLNRFLSGERDKQYWPKLEELELGFSRGGTFPSIASIILLFPALRTLSLSGPVTQPDVDVPALRGLEYVILRRQENIELAVNLGNVVTQLSLTTIPSKKQMKALSSCPNLWQVIFFISPGQERMLPRLINSISCLGIRWNSTNAGFPYEPVPGTILALVENNPMLTELHLYGVNLSPSEVSDIMESMGLRLEVFGMSLDEQYEPTRERLKYLLETAALHNSNLREIYSDVHKYVWEEFTEPVGVTSLDAVWCAFRLLQRKARKFDSYYLEEFISNL